MSETSRRRQPAFGSAPSAAPVAATPADTENSAPSVTVDASALTARYQALRQRREQINGRRVRTEVELTNAQRNEAQCAEEASKLGVSSIEELKALILRQAEEDSAALDKLEAELNKQESLLNQIDQQVAAAEAR